MAEQTSRGLSISRNGAIALAAALAVLAGAFGYRALSANGAALGAHDAAFEGQESIAALEERARSDPNNAGAWQELGFARFGRGEFALAAAAYRRAVAGDPGNAVLWSSLGEALVMASETDPMPQEALAAFSKAAALDPADPRTRYFLAVNKDLAGDHEGAIADWLALLADTPAGAPWEADLRRTIEQVGAINKITVAQRIAKVLDSRPPAMPAVSAPVPGPTQQDLAAASAIPPGEQRSMAEGMVARLETRLAGDPGNVDGWIMLMRSRMTLGQRGKATQAFSNAVAANPGRRAELEQAAKALGVL